MFCLLFLASSQNQGLSNLGIQPKIKKVVAGTLGKSCRVWLSTLKLNKSNIDEGTLALQNPSRTFLSNVFRGQQTPANHFERKFKVLAAPMMLAK